MISVARQLKPPSRALCDNAAIAWRPTAVDEGRSRGLGAMRLARCQTRYRRVRLAATSGCARGGARCGARGVRGGRHGCKGTAQCTARVATPSAKFPARAAERMWLRCQRRVHRRATPRGFEPLQAEPNGFLVHLLDHSDTVSIVATHGMECPPASTGSLVRAVARRDGVVATPYKCKSATRRGGVHMCHRATAALPRQRDGALGRCATATMPSVALRQQSELSTLSRGRVGL